MNARTMVDIAIGIPLAFVALLYLLVQLNSHLASRKIQGPTEKDTEETPIRKKAA